MIHAHAYPLLALISTVNLLVVSVVDSGEATTGTAACAQALR
jgi:hypothetical protein